MTDFPCLECVVSRSGAARYRLGHPLVDRYLEFVAGRARPNTLRAVAFDLKVFFTVVAKDPVAVAAVDVFEFLAHQRGDRTVCGWLTGSLGCRHGRLRRLSSVSGRYGYLIARADTPVQVSPVPRGLPTRHRGGAVRPRVAPLVRVPRTLPRILSPQEADRLLGALRTHRDQAMVLAMLLAGLRRCEVLGLRFDDVQVADQRLGGGGRQGRPSPSRSGREPVLPAPSAATCTTNAPPRRPRTGCSWCSRGRSVASRCRRRAWTKS